MILVSACLLGHKVKYNGGSNDDALLQACSARGRFVAVCPECFAMLPVPRPPMEAASLLLVARVFDEDIDLADLANPHRRINGIPVDRMAIHNDDAYGAPT